MLSFYPDEKFKAVKLQGPPRVMRVAISNYGRVVTYTNRMKDGHFVKGSKTDGYLTYSYKYTEDGKICNRSFRLHKKVAELFIKRPTKLHVYVLQKDKNRLNNHVNNLIWATREEFLIDYRKSPRVQKALADLHERNRLKGANRKLTPTKVQYIKKRLADPKRTMTMKKLAMQFGVSDMQISRIKSGENWGHIKID